MQQRDNSNFADSVGFKSSCRVSDGTKKLHSDNDSFGQIPNLGFSYIAVIEKRCLVKK